MALSEDEVQKLTGDVVEKVKSDKRNYALRFGKRVIYVTCPLCGRNRPLHTWKGKTKFIVKPNYAIVQVRYGGGRGVGFHLNLEESTNLSELKARYPEVYENLKAAITTLYELFL